MFDSTLLELFTFPLVDLGTIDIRLNGVLCPKPEIGVERIGITDQFLSNAEHYDALYASPDHHFRLYQQAFDTAGFVAHGDLTVLDIGAGSGANSVLPCLKLLKGCRIAATDLSPDLLRILRKYVVDKGLEDRILCVCTDAMNKTARAERFELVVGTSILHHLLDPARALEAAYQALKPGGVGIFLEPFEGVAIIRIAFDLILQREAGEKVPVDPQVRRLLTAISVDYAARAGSDKSNPQFRSMDDKWLFTRNWLESASRRVGFSDLTIIPHMSGQTLYRDYVAVLLQLGAGLTPEALPAWAWEIIDVFDNGISSEMKSDMPLEATIVIRKGPELMRRSRPSGWDKLHQKFRRVTGFGF